jgi:hypothetical protein
MLKKWTVEDLDRRESKEDLHKSVNEATGALHQALRFADDQEDCSGFLGDLVTTAEAAGDVSDCDLTPFLQAVEDGREAIEAAYNDLKQALEEALNAVIDVSGVVPDDDPADGDLEA